jgi:hypothetical protein
MGSFTRLAYVDILQQERERVLHEMNDCHDERGRFCGGSMRRQARRVRSARKQRAKDVLSRVAQAHRTLTTPGRRRALYRRERVAQQALDYIAATGFWGTLTGRAHEHKRARRRAAWQKAS